MQITIIKVKAMIVTKISAKNNMYKIAIRVDSIISLTSFMEANHICVFSLPKALYQNMEIKVNIKLTKKQKKIEVI